jgi:two-component system response regulator CpxR
MSAISSNRKILMIDDDRKLCALVKDYLDHMGFHVDLRHSGTDGLKQALAVNYDAIILDVMMPGMDGIEVLRELRKQSDVPVLMLTALGEESDRIVGLEMGADDYLPKTFSSRELLARLRAVTRRGLRLGQQASTMDLVEGDLCVNVSKHVVTLAGSAVELTALEFALLVSLLKAKGRVKTREALIEEVSDRRFDVFDRSIDVHISSLRKKLGDDPREPRFIRTIRGVGYILGESHGTANT